MIELIFVECPRNVSNPAGIAKFSETFRLLPKSPLWRIEVKTFLIGLVSLLPAFVVFR